MFIQKHLTKQNLLSGKNYQENYGKLSIISLLRMVRLFVNQLVLYASNAKLQNTVLIQNKYVWLSDSMGIMTAFSKM